MSSIIIYGKIATQPVVISMQHTAVAFILVKTDDGYKKFACKLEEKQCSDINNLTNAVFSNVVLSSTGDDVCIRVSLNPTGIIGTKILSFSNETLKIWSSVAGS